VLEHPLLCTRTQSIAWESADYFAISQQLGFCFSSRCARFQPGVRRVEGTEIRHCGSGLRLYHKGLTGRVANQEATMRAFYMYYTTVLWSGQLCVLTHHLLQKPAKKQSAGRRPRWAGRISCPALEDEGVVDRRQPRHCKGCPLAGWPFSVWTEASRGRVRLCCRGAADISNAVRRSPSTA
jgi:hypothetical protein